jgi:hypothetical protein
MKKNKLMRTLVRIKIYFDRSRAYMSYVQLFMIGVVFVDAVPFLSEWAAAKPLLTYGGCGVLTLAMAWFFGWLDTKLGVRKQEFLDNSEENPLLMEILHHVKKGQ